MKQGRPSYLIPICHQASLAARMVTCVFTLTTILMAVAPGNLKADETASDATPDAVAAAAKQNQSATTATEASPEQPTAVPEPSPSPAAMPHIRINRKLKWIDFDAKVVLRDGKWIELLVCTPGSREYESILTTEARPSHLHLALLILNQTPGSPMAWERKDDDVIPVPPTGPEVEVSIHYLKDGKPFEIPAGQWVMDRTTNAPLASSTWLFAGSKFMAVEGRPIYTADVNGSCISLVNFGDDLLTRSTSQTNHTDGGQLAANTKLIPQVGTAVVIRLKPVAPKVEVTEKKPPKQPVTQPATQPTTQPAN